MTDRRTSASWPAFVAILVVVALCIGAAVVVGANKAEAEYIEESVPAECEVRDPSCGRMTFPSWGDSSDVASPANRAAIQLADLNGDGRPELLGRGSTGLRIYTFGAAEPTCALNVQACGRWNAFVPSFVGDFSDAAGFGTPLRAASIKVGDVDGDKQDEIVSWTPTDGIVVYHFTKANNSITKWKTMPQFAKGAGAGKTDFGQARYLDTLRVVDVDGDGRAEILMRAPDGVEAWGVAPDGAVKQIAAPVPDTGDANGNWYNFAGMRSVTAVADVDGDGKREFLGLNRTTYTAYRLAAGTNGQPGTWSSLGVDLNLRDVGINAAADSAGDTFRVGSFLGDGREQVFLRGEKGAMLLGCCRPQATGGDVLYRMSIGTGRSDRVNQILIDGLPDARVKAGALRTVAFEAPPESTGLAAVGSDGAVGNATKARTQLAVLTTDGVRLVWFDGKTGDAQVTGNVANGPAFDAAHGYDTDHAGVWAWGRPGGPPLILARNASGIRTATPEHGVWESTSSRYPEFSGAQRTAYDAIGARLNIPRSEGVRKHYARDKTVLSNYRTTLMQMARPDTVDDASWKTVRDQIDRELEAAIDADAYYDELAQLLRDTYVQSNGRTNGVATKLKMIDLEKTEATNQPIEALVFMLEAADKIVAVSVHGSGEAAEAITFGLTSLIEQFKQRDHQGAITVAAAELDQKLADDFTETLNSLNSLNSQVVDDYGLLMTVGGLVSSGRWGLDANTRPKVLAAMSRGAELSIYQSLMPTLFEVWDCAKNVDRREWNRWPISFFVSRECGTAEGDIPARTKRVQPNQLIVYLAFKYEKPSWAVTPTSYGRAVDSGEILNKLFNQPGASCTEHWTSECGFGLDVNDIYLGRHGWGLQCATLYSRLDGKNFIGIRYAPPCNVLKKPSNLDEPPLPDDETPGTTVPDTTTPENTTSTAPPEDGATSTTAVPEESTVTTEPETTTTVAVPPADR